jgi:hypothetical protein
MQSELGTTIVGMSDIRPVVEFQPTHISLVAIRAVSARQVRPRHRLANHRETEPSRLGQQRQQLGRVAGYCELLTAEWDNQDVMGLR